MYIFRLKKGTFAFPEDPDGTYKAALFGHAHGISTIFIERDPPSNDFTEYRKIREKVDYKARVAANKIMTPKKAWYLHLNYDLIIESAAMDLLNSEVDLEKYRIKDEQKSTKADRTR